MSEKNIFDREDKSQSWRIFSKIFSKYDQLNKILSLGLDSCWRKKLVDQLQKRHSHINTCLDIATGTGDVAFILKQRIIPSPKVIGIDLCEEMLQVAIKKADKKKVSIQFLKGDACNLPFVVEKFDCVTMSFGIRNVVSVQKCLHEIYKILACDGVVGILEFSLPKNFFIKKLALLYLRYVVPMVGWIFSGNKEAYVYLNKTIESFPYGEEFVDIMKSSGFVNVTYRPLYFGIVTLYIGRKVV